MKCLVLKMENKMRQILLSSELIQGMQSQRDMLSEGFPLLGADQLEKMQAIGIIEPSESPCASPVVPVRKRWNPQIVHLLQSLKFSNKV